MDRRAIDLRPMIHTFALSTAARTVGWGCAREHLAQHPELLLEAERQLRQAPGLRRIAAQWRAAAEASLAQGRAERAKRRSEA
jgi:hypothetical protein